MLNHGRRKIIGAVCLAACAAGHAAANETAGADRGASDSTSGLESAITFGSQLEDGGGYTVYGGVDVSSSHKTTWSLDAHHDRASSRIPQTNVSGLSTTGLIAGVRHDFSASGIVVKVGGWQDPNVVRATEASGMLRLGGDALNAGLELEGRHSSFEPFNVNTVVTLGNGKRQAVNGTASCSLDNMGYGLRLAFKQNGWSGYLNGMKYAYSSTDCGFSSPGLAALRKTNASQFRQLAATLTRRLSRSSANKLTASDSFLDYDLSGGLSYEVNTLTYGVDLDHSRDQFDDIVANSVSGNVALELGSAWLLEFEAGASKSNAFGTLPFGGVSVTRTF